MGGEGLTRRTMLRSARMKYHPSKRLAPLNTMHVVLMIVRAWSDTALP